MVAFVRDDFCQSRYDSPVSVQDIDLKRVVRASSEIVMFKGIELQLILSAGLGRDRLACGSAGALVRGIERHRKVAVGGVGEGSSACRGPTGCKRAEIFIVDRHRIGKEVIPIEGIIARPAVNHVVARTPDNTVIADGAGQCVVVRRPLNGIVDVLIIGFAVQFSVRDLRARRILRVGQAADRVGVARLDGPIGDIADQHAADLDLIEVDRVAEFIGECGARLQIDAARSDGAATRVRNNSALPAVAANFIARGPAIIPDLNIAAKDGVVIGDRKGIAIILGVPPRIQLEPVASEKSPPSGKVKASGAKAVYV